MASRNPACTPDYSPAFKRLTGFRGTPTGIRPGTVADSGSGTSYHGKDAFSGRRSPVHPDKVGGKKPRTGK